VGVFVNVNPNRTNAIFGATTTCVLGRTYLEEKFAGLTFQIRPETFFQVYTEQAEALLEAMLAHLNLQGDEVLLDAYCGIGTLTLPLAKRVKQVVGIEMQPAAVEQALNNAALNGLTNVSFQTGTVEKLLSVVEIKPDIIVLDPPRKGCEGTVVESLRHMGAARIVYMSCNPATLARDLKAFCADGMYRLEKVITADLFPQTSHVESIAFLTRG
jgi:23S rRNA (uracil1939-C5)-methyltransferase